MKLELICLGIGNGMSYVMRGIPSTAFALFADGKPFLLIDCGAGIALSYKNLLGDNFPARIFVTHNHMDHTGDLPILTTYLLKKQGIMPTVSGHPDVLDIVKKHRFHELCTKGDQPEDRANWAPADAFDALALGDDISLRLLPCKHSYLCYGFILYHRENPLMAYSADTAFQQEIYQRLLEAPFIVVDGRETEPPGEEHASFSQIEGFFGEHRDKRVAIVHYESASYQLKYPHIAFMKTGDRTLL